MKKRPFLFVLVGLLTLLIGAVLELTGGPPQADAALLQQCQEKMRAPGYDASMVAQCKDTAFASMMTATDAGSAARAVSAANTTEIGGNTLAMFLMGLGLVLTAGGFAAVRASRRPKQ